MCLDPEALNLFLSMIDPDVIKPHLNGLLVGEAQTLWVWVADVGKWCINGVVK
uniref:Uncharacterized protein n=1 Tax=Dinoroseobacter phage vB_DshS_R26L TaxID=3161158 RepID=A0AAU7VGC8_9CAUD